MLILTLVVVIIIMKHAAMEAAIKHKQALRNDECAYLKTWLPSSGLIYEKALIVYV